MLQPKKSLVCTNLIGPLNRSFAGLNKTLNVPVLFDTTPIPIFNQLFAPLIA